MAYQEESSVLILADGTAGFERAAAAAQALEHRVIGRVPIGGGRERLQRQALTDIVLIELDGDPGEALEPLLGELNEGVSAGRYAAIISLPFDLLDRVYALASPAIELLPDVDHLCRLSALAVAAAPRRHKLNDIGRDEGRPKLRQVAEEVRRIAALLSSLSEDEARRDSRGQQGSAAPEGKLEPGFVRSIIRARRLRDQYFQSGLFADPAWDMLLDLMAARLEGQRVAVSSLCIAAAVPPTTALRWIKTLTDEGLLIRTADPQDGRRVYIELSDEVAANMVAYLAAAQRISPLTL